MNLPLPRLLRPGPAAVVVLATAFVVGWLVAGGNGHTKAPAGLAVPDGMVYVPGGITHIGADDGPPEERPVFAARVAPFFMDIHPVTVAQFRKFVQQTGYVTEAERLGDAGVYDSANGGWKLVAGANWHHPMGPTAPAAADDHPVTQVSWNDAVAYAHWAGKRLPSEVEWEHAARNARDDRDRYSWGEALLAGGRHHANVWQGNYPGSNTGEDGYLFTSPVGAFGATELGLTDTAGNVWEWTADGFRPYPLDDSAPSPANGDKVQRGGSFLCHASYCHGYRVSGRSHSSPDTALFHVGFRLVKDVDA